jgi:hypothetical protein
VLERITIDIAKILPKETEREEISTSWLPRTTSVSDWRFRPSLTKSHQQWWMLWWSNSVASGSKRASQWPGPELWTEVLQCLRVINTYVKMMEDDLRKVTSTHHGNWEKRLPIFPLGNKASTHKTTGMKATSMVFGRKVHLALWPTVRGSPQQGKYATDYVAELVDQLHDIHHYAHLKVATD